MSEQAGVPQHETKEEAEIRKLKKFRAFVIKILDADRNRKFRDGEGLLRTKEFGPEKQHRLRIHLEVHRGEYQKPKILDASDPNIAADIELKTVSMDTLGTKMTKTTTLLANSNTQKLERLFDITTPATEHADTKDYIEILNEKGVDALMNERLRKNRAMEDEEAAGMFDIDDTFLDAFLEAVAEIIEKNP